ncbi:MAG: hypothetical protein LBU87_05745 [Lactobacillales bacterium]|jgi:hypothetical protein|nr:hypothetical protein [Lactobacillales bacterium]
MNNKKNKLNLSQFTGKYKNTDAGRFKDENIHGEDSFSACQLMHGIRRFTHHGK